MRSNQRNSNQLRPITFTRHYTKHAEGSVFVAFGDTQLICTASVNNSVPRFLKGSGRGWVTAEYGMLPRSTHERIEREAHLGKQSGRTQEIQRLIGRSLRTAIDLSALGEHTITLDCDVIQADGGTRTAAITGSCIALYDALTVMLNRGLIQKLPFKGFVASVSVGIYQNQALLDLDYREDSQAETDMNVAMTEHGEFIEIQGTAEKRSFSEQELSAMLALAKQGIAELIAKQKTILEIS